MYFRLPNSPGTKKLPMFLSYGILTKCGFLTPVYEVPEKVMSVFFLHQVTPVSGPRYFPGGPSRIWVPPPGQGRDPRERLCRGWYTLHFHTGGLLVVTVVTVKPVIRGHSTIQSSVHGWQSVHIWETWIIQIENICCYFLKRFLTCIHIVTYSLWNVWFTLFFSLIFALLV